MQRLQVLPHGSTTAATTASVVEACRILRDAPIAQNEALMFGSIIKLLAEKQNKAGMEAFVRGDGIELLIRATSRCYSPRFAGCCVSAISALLDLYDVSVLKPRIVACGGIQLLHKLVDSRAALKDGVSYALMLLIALKVRTGIPVPVLQACRGFVSHSAVPMMPLVLLSYQHPVISRWCLSFRFACAMTSTNPN